MHSDGASGSKIPVKSAMYHVQRVAGDKEIVAKADTKLYKIKSFYEWNVANQSGGWPGKEVRSAS